MKEKWFDIRLEKNIMACRQNKAPEEEATEHSTITSESLQNSRAPPETADLSLEYSGHLNI